MTQFVGPFRNLRDTSRCINSNRRAHGERAAAARMPLREWAARVVVVVRAKIDIKINVI